MYAVIRVYRDGEVYGHAYVKHKSGSTYIASNGVEVSFKDEWNTTPSPDGVLYRILKTVETLDMAISRCLTNDEAFEIGDFTPAPDLNPRNGKHMGLLDTTDPCHVPDDDAPGEYDDEI